jgi:Patatin-like phospholipase
MKTALIALISAALVGCATEKRPERTLEDLVAARRADDAAREAQARRSMEALMALAEGKVKASPKGGPSAAPPTIDLLVISGGGDWGAFGAGVLKGWGRVKGEMARPQFDIVTGVSTGALIAPFAFVGDDAAIESIVQLYRNPEKDLAVSRGWMFFLPNNPSFFVLPGLERKLRTTLDRPMIERIAAAGGTGRYLLVNTTNVDFGDMHVWDIVAEARKALAANDESRVHNILLASAGIPAVFPARGIDGYLYVDGAITGNILYGGRIREGEGLSALWRAKYPTGPAPRIRYWIIFNNQLRFPPQVTQDRWPDVMGRATIMSTQTSTINAIRHLFAGTELTKLKHNIDMEVRLLSVPDDWVPPKAGTFVAEVMNNLADVGEKMGADPASWRTTPP